jgi:ParB family chromosome partitioning protein
VRAVGDGYELVSGERRLRAAGMAGLDRVPAIMVEPDDARGALTISLVENVQREDLNCIELARAYRQLHEEFGRTQEEIASAVGKSRPHIANTLRLLELDEAVQQALEEGKISAGHARALLMAPLEARKLLFHRMVQGGISVRQAERAARRVTKGDGSAGRVAKAEEAVDPAEVQMVKEMERAVGSALGRKCVIERAAGGGGRLMLEFYGDRDLEALVERLRGDR